jgi:hypothetical protein
MPDPHCCDYACMWPCSINRLEDILRTETKRGRASMFQLGSGLETISRGLPGIFGEISGAFGDLGTLLPYVVAGLMSGFFAPFPVFAGFAAGYLLVAVTYRLPVPVQPMKALGAAILTGTIAPVEVAWAGAIIGGILLVISVTPRIDRAARLIPQSVIVGLQVGLGITLGAVAVKMMDKGWQLALPTLMLLSLSLIWRRGPWAILAVGGGIIGGTLGDGETTAHLFHVSDNAPTAANIIVSGIIPQLPLTLLNAVVLTAALSRSLYGVGAARVSERKLAASSGILNLVMLPLGAFPMCHGAGGVTAHYRFGARGIGAPLLMAALCAAAALSGPGVVNLLGAIPLPVIGALLAYASADLAFSRRLIDARADCRPVIAATAVTTFFLGAALGLVVGIAAEVIRVGIKRRAAARTT